MKRKWRSLLFPITILALFCCSIRPLEQDLSLIEAASDLRLQGQEDKGQTEQQDNHEQEKKESAPTVAPAQGEAPLPPEQEVQPLDENSATPSIADGHMIPPMSEQPPDTPENESSHIEIVEDGIVENRFFSTNLVDNGIVTTPTFHVTITHLDNTLRVQQMMLRLNDEPERPFSQELEFTEGHNKVTITVLYKNLENETVTATRSYDVILNTKDTMIFTNLQDIKVTQPTIRFIARAEKNGKNMQLEVKVNDETIISKTDSAYSASLKEGENIIILQANDVTKQYHVTYDKPKTKLTFKTDLKDMKVGNPQLRFMAEALYEDESVDFTATLNGQNITSAQNLFTIQLAQGTNIIQLHTAYNGEQLTKQYKVLYADPNSSVSEEKDPLAPIIKTDLTNDAKVKGLIKTINIWPTASDGTRIRGKNVAVTVNGSGVPFVWDDAEKTSYKLQLQDGRNEVTIRVWDEDGRVTKEHYILTAEDMENKVIGQVTVSVEASVLGIPYIIPPTKMDIHQGEKGSFIVDQLLRQNGFSYINTGTLQNNFYLSAIKKQNMLSSLSIPDDLWELVETHSTRADREDYDMHSLGEFDFASGSGWMFSINGDYPNYGFSDAYFLDGDVVRVRFTLHYGKDIRGFGGMGGGSGSNWNKEW